jgi:hypothetical protein
VSEVSQYLVDEPLFSFRLTRGPKPELQPLIEGSDFLKDREGLLVRGPPFRMGQAVPNVMIREEASVPPRRAALKKLELTI